MLLAILLLLLPGQDRPGRAAAEAEMQQGQHKARNADFHAAIRHFERAAIAYRLFKDPMGETTALIRAGETARTMGEIGKAHEYLLRAEGIGPESSLSPQIRGELFHLRSNLLSDEGDYPRAIREMKMAVRYKRLGGPSQDSSISLSINNIGYNFYFLNQYDSALHYYQEAVKVLDPAAHPASLDLAMYYQNIGIVHAIQGRLDTALNYMERSAGIRESGLPDDDPDLAYTYTNLGRLYRMLGDDPKAFEYNTRAEQVYIKHFGTEYPGLGTLYLNTGNNLKVMGDYDRAVSYYRKSLHIYTLGGNLSHPNIAKIYNNLGAVYLLMDQDSLAEDHLSRSLSLGTEESLQTITFRNLARIRQRKGDYASALAYLQRAGQTLSSTEGDLRAETANLSLDYGLLYKDMGLTDSALARTEEAIRILISYYGQHHPDLSEAYQAKAALLEMNGQPEQALLLYHDALRALVPGFNATDPLMNPVYSEGIITIEVLDPILGKAEALTALAGRDPRGPHLRHALDMLLQASELADAIRNQLAENSKQLLTRTLRSLYEKGLYLTCLLHQRERDPSLLEHAFLFTEKSKYAVLLSSMRDVE
ncbi:MAG TPA: tetratricopeptide repeat protein, partial [Bacteroidales bacterium]|nr:tetratricopeptide repeat protein [Bacteroidales bacterium]